LPGPGRPPLPQGPRARPEKSRPSRISSWERVYDLWRDRRKAAFTVRSRGTAYSAFERSGSMKGYARLAAATLLLAAAAVSAEPPTSAKNHAKTLAGTVAAVDPGGKSLTVRDAKGKETTVVMTGATRVTGGKLEKGEKVTVRWMVREKQS